MSSSASAGKEKAAGSLWGNSGLGPSDITRNHVSEDVDDLSVELANLNSSEPLIIHKSKQIPKPPRGVQTALPQSPELVQGDAKLNQVWEVVNMLYELRDGDHTSRLLVIVFNSP